MSNGTLNHVFKPFKNKHLGESAVLLGTGPSLNYYDFQECLIPGVIKVGLNSIITKSIDLDYYFCGHVDWRSREYFPVVKAKQSLTKFGYILVNGVKTEECMSPEEAEGLGLIPYEISNNLDDFYYDISKWPLMNHLISFSALQFLIYCGFKTIYLVGLDTNKVTSCDILDSETQRDIDLVVSFYRKFSVLAEHREVEIISINPARLAGIFTDVYRHVPDLHI